MSEDAQAVAVRKRSTHIVDVTACSPPPLLPSPLLFSSFPCSLDVGADALAPRRPWSTPFSAVAHWADPLALVLARLLKPYDEDALPPVLVQPAWAPLSSPPLTDPWAR